MSKKKEFTLRWKRKGKYYKKTMNREEVSATFEGLMKGFPTKNENSTKIVQLIPQVDDIYIDFDDDSKWRELFYTTSKAFDAINIEDCHIAILAIWNAYCMEGESNKYVIMSWKAGGKYYTKNLERKEFISRFQGLLLAYPDKCDISRKLVSVIPFADKFYIDWDSTKDVNELYYKVGETDAGIPIVSYHKIVWHKLEEFCKEGEQTEKLVF